MKFITIVSGPFALKTVLRDTAPNLVLYDVHADLLHAVTKLTDIKTDYTVAQINIGPVIKDIQ